MLLTNQFQIVSAARKANPHSNTSDPRFHGD